MPRSSVFAAVVLTGLAGCSSGQPRGDHARSEKKALEDSEVPAPVLASLSKAHPAAKTATWAQAGETYEVRFDDGGRFAMDFKADGSLKGVTQEIALETAPDAVKKAIAASRYAAMPVLSATKSDKTGKPTSYRFVFKDGEKGWRAAFDVAGAVAKEKEISKEKLEKWQKEHATAAAITPQ
jgi:hypothetical protein